MKPGDLEYMALVEKKREEIRGNISSTKMTPEEYSAEVEVNFAPVVKVARAELEKEFPIKKKRGRPPGVKNKPKPPKGS